jgi:hypothetical protein
MARLRRQSSKSQIPSPKQIPIVNIEKVLSGARLVF